MALFIVQYSFSSASAPGRDDHRAAHREWLRGLLEQERLLVGGPYPDGTGAMAVVEAPDRESVRNWFDDDPFLREDLVDELSVVEWVPTMGRVGAG